jgi:hypothetical protein
VHLKDAEAEGESTIKLLDQFFASDPKTEGAVYLDSLGGWLDTDFSYLPSNNSSQDSTTRDKKKSAPAESVDAALAFLW